ncbi:hypothetical protein MMC07_005465, partial [Pseudocyphellaria aurata]|nr:hypothetical protein [Pseudocyphellaria aurata]
AVAFLHYGLDRHSQRPTQRNWTKVIHRDNPDSIFGPQKNIIGINAKGDEPCGREYDRMNHGDEKGRLWTRQTIDQLIVGRMYGNDWCWTTIAIHLTWEHQDLSTLIEEELALIFSFMSRFKRYKHWLSKTYVDEDVQRILNRIYAVLQDERRDHDSTEISDWRRQRPVFGIISISTLQISSFVPQTDLAPTHLSSQPTLVSPVSAQPPPRVEHLPGNHLRCLKLLSPRIAGRSAKSWNGRSRKSPVDRAKYAGGAMGEEECKAA